MVLGVHRRSVFIFGGTFKTVDLDGSMLYGTVRKELSSDWCVHVCECVVHECSSDLGSGHVL